MSAEVLKIDIPSTISALKHLVQAPDIYDGEIFQRYPGMKLGYETDVDFFAGKLCELAMRVVASDAGADAWMLTAPAYHHLPSAANLLAERLHAMLRHRGVVWPLVELRLLPEQVAIHSLEEFRRSYEYSRSPVTQRIAERKRLHDATRLDSDWQRFAGRRVMVVNDIHVTGTQQRFMHSSLAAAGATACLWLYIFHVDGELARTYPEVEHRINNCNLADLDSYASVLASTSTRHTARCLSRLFNEDLDNFRYLVFAIPPQSRERIYHAAMCEGRYDIPLFAEKMRLLNSNESDRG
jgi:hypothetical protein